jgi:hypothetical protein
MQCARSITETNFCGTRIYRRFAFLRLLFAIDPRAAEVCLGNAAGTLHQ